MSEESYITMNLSEESSVIVEDRKRAIDNYIYKNLDIDDRKLEDAVKHLPNAGGKRLRPLLLILSAETVSDVNYQDIIPVASGFEALHTSSLIQDDNPSMDDHNMRRGVKTVHRKYNSAVSVLSSDILRSKATTWCTRLDEPKYVVDEVIEEFDKTVEEMCIGQRMDLNFDRENRDVTIDDYIDMVSKKTAQIYSSSAKCGGIVTKSSVKDTERLEKFGRLLGIGFQIVDDILDIQSEITGKDSSFDIKNQKRTVITIYAKKQGMPVFSDEYSISEKINMIENSGSIQNARNMAGEYIDRAVDELKKVETENQDSRRVLMEIAEETKGRRY